MKRLEYYIKNNAVLQFIFKFGLSFVMKTISFFIPINNKMILFTAHNGGINDSPRLIYEQLIRQNNMDYVIVWGVNKNYLNTIFNGRTVRINSFKYFLISMRAKYWVASVNIERGLNYKKRNQVYLNTWHGIPIKKIGNDVLGRRDFNFSKVNYFVVSSDYEIPIYRRALKVRDNSFLRVGLPRNMELFEKKNEDFIQQLRIKLGIGNDKRIILYAPTWRESDDSGKSYTIKPPINLDLWKNTLSNDFVVLFRLHPYTEKALQIQFDSFCIDASNYPNLNELIILSDILITDYSSIAFDYALTGKPMLCFAYDFGEYKNRRGLYLDLETEFPGGVIQDQIMLLDRIMQSDASTIFNKVDSFSNKYNHFFDNPAENCLKILLGPKIQ
ncbi:MAG: CDP-glycerol glycerophosphotransferase family protein [Acholeplasmataceae bacterium]